MLRIAADCMLQLLAYAPYILIGLALWLGFSPVTRYRLRHIPGPFGWPFLGNLMPLMKEQQHRYFLRMRQQYGPIFKVWVGTEPWVIVAEPNAVRKLAFKINNHDHYPHTLAGEQQYILEHTLLFLRNEEWRLMKQAWDPAVLHRASLEGYAPLMQESGEQLLGRLENWEKRGEVVDIWNELSKMTLDVVGTCAFGIKFNGSAKDSATTGGSWAGLGGQLRKSCQQFFTCMELDQASAWLVPTLIFPAWSGVFRKLAYLLPDKGQIAMSQTMKQMTAAARMIIDTTQEQRQQQEAGGGAPGAAAAGGQDGKGPLRGVLPGSFVAQLEAWRAKHGSAMDIDDDLLAAQVITFLLAGYETTANAMSFLVYHLSVNPEAQRKVQEELEAVLGGRKPTLDDLPKLEYLQACIQETLRATPINALLIRKTAPTEHNLTVLGKAIPPGTHIAIFTYGLHHDPRYWERPEEFLPERFLPETNKKLGPFHEYAYVPFGAGGRKCPGYKFAEQEMALVAAALLQRLSFTRPVEAGPQQDKSGLTMGPKGGVQVLLARRG